MHTVETADSSTPLRSAQNDSAHLTFDLEVTHDVKVSDLHKKWSYAPEYRAAYEELGPKFDLTRALIEARIGAKLTQAQLAERMQTTQSVIARNTP